MSCAPFQELLAASMDDELSQPERLELERHVAECTACRSLQQRLARLEAGFTHLPVAVPPPLRPSSSVTPLPARQGPTWGVTALWSTLLLSAACAALSFWSPARPASSGSELYFCSHQLQHQHPQEETLMAGEFRSPPLHGKALERAELAFEIHLDSDHHGCKDLQLEVEYDFDGDGHVDRSEVYASFDTDDKDGWEIYTHRHGPIAQQGEMRDFTGGTVACRLKNASAVVQVLQGNSKLILPHQISV